MAFTLSLAESPACLATIRGVERHVCADPSGIEEFPASGVFIAPNPFRDYFSIIFPDHDLHQVRIWNTLGVPMAEVFARQRAVVQSHSWPSGVYILQTDDHHSIMIIKH
ncbi:MAG: T9SS type A sorting domain-containing protein [Bacteroidales bacterium]